MNREFKFMAFDKEMKQLLTWEEIQKEWESEGYFDSFFRCDHWESLQYTGHNDIKRTKEFPNGQEIYEGFIVKCFGFNYQISYDKIKCKFVGINISKKDDLVLEFPQISQVGEIVGNIFEIE